MDYREGRFSVFIKISDRNLNKCSPYRGGKRFVQKPRGRQQRKTEQVSTGKMISDPFSDRRAESLYLVTANEKWSDNKSGRNRNQPVVLSELRIQRYLKRFVLQSADHQLMLLGSDWSNPHMSTPGHAHCWCKDYHSHCNKPEGSQVFVSGRDDTGCFCVQFALWACAGTLVFSLSANLTL